MSETFQNVWAQEFEILFWIKRSKAVVVGWWGGGCDGWMGEALLGMSVMEKGVWGNDNLIF